MTDKRLKLLIYPALYLLILVGANALRFVPPHILSYKMIHMLQYMIYVLLILAWARSTSVRLYHLQIRVYHSLLILCFMLELFFRGLRHIVFMGVLPWERIFWYWYYVPELAIPMISWYMTQYIGKKEGYRMPVKYFLTLIPYAALSLAILTNDHHQLAFRVDLTASSLTRTHHVSYLYFVAQIWLFLFAILAIVRLYRVCKKAGLRAYIWPPAAIVAFGIFYTVLYTLNRSDFGVGFIESRAMSFTVIIGVWESCLTLGLIPNNRFYDRFFAASDIPMEILDNAGQVHFISAGAKEYASAQKDVSFREREHAITGGIVRWREDITENVRVASELEEANAQMEEANKRLALQARIKLDTGRAKERARLYDTALSLVSKQVEDAEAILEKCRPLSGQALKDMLGRLCVPASYVKRRSNLVLIAENEDTLPVQELHFCLRELHEALLLIPVQSHYETVIEGTPVAGARTLMEVYDAIQKMVEEALPQLKEIRITLKADEQNAAVDARIHRTDGACLERGWQL